MPGRGAQVPLPDPTPSPQGTGSGSAPVPASAATAHDMLIAIGIMSLFVYVMVLLAGTSRTAGRLVIALFIALLILQGLGRVNPFAWFAKHPLTRPTTGVQK